MVLEEASLGLGLQTPSSRHWDGSGRRKIMVVVTSVFLLMVMLPVSEGLRRKVDEKGPGFGAKDSDVTIFEQPHRTGFHFQPQKNWMNGMESNTGYNKNVRFVCVCVCSFVCFGADVIVYGMMCREIL